MLRLLNMKCWAQLPFIWRTTLLTNERPSSLFVALTWIKWPEEKDLSVTYSLEQIKKNFDGMSKGNPKNNRSWSQYQGQRRHSSIAICKNLGIQTNNKEKSIVDLLNLNHIRSLSFLNKCKKCCIPKMSPNIKNGVLHPLIKCSS